MKNYVLILIALFLTGTYATAQVGIGNATPDAKSILDLTNTNGKYLVLPFALVVPDTSAASLGKEGALIYYKGVIYCRTANRLRALTPWNWDGDSTHPIYLPKTAQLGVGIYPEAALVKMQIADSNQANVIGARGALAIGYMNYHHLLIDNNEIMAKNGPSTPSTLRFQKQGGLVAIGDSVSVPSATTALAVTGSIDAVNKGKIKENGNDLLPQGSIIMWSGAAVPAGWALCDGGTYPKVAGGTATTPNLMDRFVVGANATGGSGTAGTYTIGTSGGNDNIILTVAQMPTHNHGGSVSGGAHTHTYNDSYSSSSCKDGVFSGQSGCYMSLVSDVNKTETTTVGDGTHTHSIANDGSSSPIDIRPKFYALAYIMKL
jgi:microcystin-dependent protein